MHHSSCAQAMYTARIFHIRVKLVTFFQLATNRFRGLWMRNRSNVISQQMVSGGAGDSDGSLHSFVDDLGVCNADWGSGTWSYNMMLWTVWPGWFRSDSAELCNAGVMIRIDEDSFTVSLELPSSRFPRSSLFCVQIHSYPTWHL